MTSSPKGYPVERNRDDTDLTKLSLQLKHSTVVPKGNNRRGLDVVGGGFYEVLPAVVVEAGSTDNLIKVTAHTMKIGDLIRIKTTANNIQELELYVEKVIDVNTVSLAGLFSASLAAGDTFDLLRYVSPKVAPDGSSLASVVAAPIKFLKGAAGTYLGVEVTKDTSVPTNTAALPVEIVGVTGQVVTVNSGDINVQTSRSGLGHDSVRIGNDLLELGYNDLGSGIGEAKVRDADANIALGSILSKIIVAPATAAKQDTVKAVLDNILLDLQLKADLLETQPVSVTALPLPTGAATTAKQDTAKAVLDNILLDLQLKADLLETQPVSVTALPLPTGAATTAKQDTAKAVLDNILLDLQLKADLLETQPVSQVQLPVALGQLTKSASLAVTLASDSDPVILKALDTISFARLKMAVTNVTNAAYTEVIGTVGATPIRKIKLFMSSGTPLVLATGAIGSEIDRAYIPAGGYPDGVLEISIAAGVRVSVKSLDGTVAAGEIIANFMG